MTRSFSLPIPPKQLALAFGTVALGRDELREWWPPWPENPGSEADELPRRYRPTPSRQIRDRYGAQGESLSTIDTPGAAGEIDGC